VKEDPEIQMAFALSKLALHERRALELLARSGKDLINNPRLRKKAVAAEIAYESTGRLRPHAYRLLRDDGTEVPA